MRGSKIVRSSYILLLPLLLLPILLIAVLSNLSSTNQAGVKRARSADADQEPAVVELAPELALPDNGNSNALIYSLSSQLPQPAFKQQVPSSDTSSKSPKQQRDTSAQPAPASSHKTQASAKKLSKPISASAPNHQVKAPKDNKHHTVAGDQCKYDYPNLLDLQFNNIHWQRLTSSARANDSRQSNFYLYNAYYDDRWRAGLPSVRVLAMIDRIEPPPTNCLLWSSKLRKLDGKLQPLVSQASFVYAWYPKWGNYKDGFLQPWIVTCPISRAFPGLVPDSVSLVQVPAEVSATRERRDAPSDGQSALALPPSYSSSSSSSPASGSSVQPQAALAAPPSIDVPKPTYDCTNLAKVTNNLPVYNQYPPVKEKFAVCVKGLDFPNEDVSVRLVEWIELLNLLGAGKIFFYNLDVHENISKVLHYYQKRGIVELSPLTLPGDQPNLPEYQHLYLKSKLTAKRQNELIPYNDCLYRNLNSYQYLALLDIDEIIMPLKHHNWYDLMQEVETLSLSEQNYSRASYNVRNVYFFDDLAGPLGTTSSTSSSSASSESGSNSDDQPDVKQQVASSDQLERGFPHYLHMMQHVYRSKNYTKPGQYVKCFHNTDRVVSLHNHFPMNCFGQCTTYSIPVHLAHLQHYRKDCVGPLKQSCKNDFRVFTTRDTTVWKYKQQMIRRTTRVLSQLGLISSASS